MSRAYMQTTEYKEKMRKIALKRGYGKWMKGKKLSSEHVKNMSKGMMGKNRTHGMFGTSLYRIWSGMLQRCNNPNSKYYEYYGGRSRIIILGFTRHKTMTHIKSIDHSEAVETMVEQIKRSVKPEDKATTIAFFQFLIAYLYMAIKELQDPMDDWGKNDGVDD